MLTSSAAPTVAGKPRSNISQYCIRITTAACCYVCMTLRPSADNRTAWRPCDSCRPQCQRVTVAGGGKSGTRTVTIAMTHAAPNRGTLCRNKHVLTRQSLFCLSAVFVTPTSVPSGVLAVCWVGTIACITEPSGSDKPLLSDKVMTVYGPYRRADIITDTKCMYCSTVTLREKVTGGWTNCMGSRNSSVGIVSKLWFGQSGFRISSNVTDFSSLKRPDLLVPKLLPPYGHRQGQLYIFWQDL
jgi:hypothetical protein